MRISRANLPRLILVAVTVGAAANANAQTAGSPSIAGAYGTATLYGVADVYFGNLRGELLRNRAGAAEKVSESFTGFGSGGVTSSRLGVRGETAPFAGNLQGLFTLELGPLRLESTANNTNGLDKTRKSFVGLKGGFGQVIVGRVQSPAYEFAFKYDALSGQMGPSYPIQIISGAGINSADRLNNAVTYSSPTIANFKGQLTYSAGGTLDVSSDDGIAANHKQTVMIAAIDYDNGPLSVGVVYRRAGDTNGLCTTAAGALTTCASAGSVVLRDGKDEWGVGASYEFGFARVYAAYQQVDPNAVGAYVTKLPHIALSLPVSKVDTVLVDYAWATRQRDVTSGGVTETVTGKAQAFGLAFTHDFDKRITGYVGLVWGKNGDHLVGSGLNLGFINPAAAATNSATTVYASAPQSSYSGVMTGLRFTF